MHTSKRIKPYIIQTVLGWALATVSIIAMLAITFGLYAEYKGQLAVVERNTAILAGYAANPEEVTTVADVTVQLFEDDSNIKDIQFYPFDRSDTHLENTNLSFLDVLITDTVSVYEPVVSFTGLQEEVNVEKIIGYIVVDMNVGQMRKSWLDRHILWISILIVSFMLSVGFLLYSLNKPANQLMKLANMSRVLLTPEGMQSFFPATAKLKFIELRKIRQTLMDLANKRNQATNELDKLQKLNQTVAHKDLSLNIQQSYFQQMVTHEIKTSLNAVVGGVQLLEQQYLTDGQKDAVKVIKKGSEQLNHTVEQIVQLNKLQKGQLIVEAVDFRPLQLIKHIVFEYKEITKDKGLTIVLDIQHDDTSVKGDSQKLISILRAIIENAIKYTEEGSITIFSDIYKNAKKETEWHVKVIDTGIDEKYQDEIFLPFFQVDPTTNREYEGVGIGLSLTQQMVKLLGGSLVVNSQAEVGSIFEIKVPLASNKGSFIGLLKDTKVVYFATSEYLELNRVVAAENLYCVKSIKETMELVNSNTIDVLLVSSSVKEKDAIEVTELIREKETTSRMLIIRGFDKKDNRFTKQQVATLQAVGFDNFVPNDISLEEISHRIYNWLGHS